MNGAWAGVVDAAAGTDGRGSSADAEVSAEPYAVQLVERHACLGEPCRPQGIMTQFCKVVLAGYFRAPATGAIFLSGVPSIFVGPAMLSHKRVKEITPVEQRQPAVGSFCG